MQVSEDSRLDDRVVMITGAGSGIGRAAVRAFAVAGALVVAAGRRGDALHGSVTGLPADRVRTVACDVSDEQQVAALVATAVSHFGRLDAAFNAAGTFGEVGPLHADTTGNFDTVVGTNLRGVWLCMKHQIAAMLDAGGGSIVNCASVAAHIGHGGSAIYSASKHAVVGLSKSAALQYARMGIRVNVVSPGSTDTEMLRALYGPDDLRSRADRAPLGRLGRPEEVAAAAVWLASPASAYVTGQAIAVDGGVTAGTAGGGRR
jgi:A-factor type gamma-butyrolactone 1'-reductase (1S-forming)